MNPRCATCSFASEASCGSWRASFRFVRMHWDSEPLAVQRQTESADKSDALQTLCAVRRRPAVAKRLECVRLQRRFPKPGYDSMTGPVHGEQPFVFAHSLGQ